MTISLVPILLPADPTQPLAAATKQYVDNKSVTLPPESDAQKNTNFGIDAMPTPGAAFESTAIGQGALRQAVSGQGTAVGYLALGAVPSATESTAVGGQTGLLATGTALTLIGHGAGYYPVDLGASNQATMIGAYACSYTPGGGTQATALGFQARAAIAGTALGTQAQARGLYSTAVGHGAIATLDNQIVLGTATEHVLIPGLLITAPPTAASSGFRLPHGVAPSNPKDGDMWTTSAGLQIRINGVTKTFMAR